MEDLSDIPLWLSRVDVFHHRNQSHSMVSPSIDINYKIFLNLFERIIKKTSPRVSSNISFSIIILLLIYSINLNNTFLIYYLFLPSDIKQLNQLILLFTNYRIQDSNRLLSHSLGVIIEEGHYIPPFLRFLSLKKLRTRMKQNLLSFP